MKNEDIEARLKGAFHFEVITSNLQMNSLLFCIPHLSSSSITSRLGQTGPFRLQDSSKILSISSLVVPHFFCL
jgi:hypothetical protein